MTNAEKLARAFHESYERLAPEYGYETREETKIFDSHTPNGKLMIAVCEEISVSQAKKIENLEGWNKEMYDNHRIETARLQALIDR